jgi:hypothetical protein
MRSFRQAPSTRHALEHLLDRTATVANRLDIGEGEAASPEYTRGSDEKRQRDAELRKGYLANAQRSAKLQAEFDEVVAEGLDD